ncbi:MAG: hypothetical protein AB8G26_05840 [Ilumatobacter sp.]
MFNRINTKRTRNGLVGLALAGAGIVGATGVASAASDTAADASPEAAAVFAQADGDAELTATERQERRQERREARQERREARQEFRAELAELLGLDVDALGEQIRDGATLAEIAEAQGVEVSVVVDFIVAEKTERLDGAVENGRLTQEEADEKAADLEERVQTRVEEGRSDDGERGRRGGFRGGGSPDVEAPADGQG